MYKYRSEQAVREALKDLVIVCDTREQDTHVQQYLQKNNIPTVSRKLDTGDYSAMLEDMTLEKDCCIERKGSLNELCENFTASRVRFEDEFIRARAFGTKVFLVVEDATWDDIYVHNYSSKLNEKALIASLLAWQTRYNVTIIFCKKQNVPKTIYGILWYAAREKLMGG